MTIIEAAKISVKAELRMYVPAPIRHAACEAYGRAMSQRLITRAEWDELRRQALIAFDPCYCPACPQRNCPYRDEQRRLHRFIDGRHLCPNLDRCN